MFALWLFSIYSFYNNKSHLCMYTVHWPVRNLNVVSPYAECDARVRHVTWQSMLSECRIFSAFDMSAGYEFTPARVKREPYTSTSAKHTGSVRLVKSPFSLAPRLQHLSVERVRLPYVLRTLCALIKTQQQPKLTQVHRT